jgi:hypothetical protein
MRTLREASSRSIETHQRRRQASAWVSTARGRWPEEDWRADSIDGPQQFDSDPGDRSMHKRLSFLIALTAAGVFNAGCGQPEATTGGVLFGNLANGSFAVTASKAPFSYSALTFTIQDGIGLYVASPPHATQGTNDSPPGQP